MLITAGKSFIAGSWKSFAGMVPSAMLIYLASYAAWMDGFKLAAVIVGFLISLVTLGITIMDFRRRWRERNQTTGNTANQGG
jgi:hypothetical protein